MSLLSNYRTVDLFGIKIYSVRMDDILAFCEDHIKRRSNLCLGMVNVAKIVNSRTDLSLRRSLNEADIILADGLPIVWLSRLVGKPLLERVAGIDIMFCLLENASKKKYRVFFLGARREILQKVIQGVQTKYPGVCIAGYIDGYFKESEELNVAKQIKDSSADILFVAMSSPKKEDFLRKWRKFMDVPICHGVGSSFDVFAGVTKRAPIWMQKSGLEWLYRVIQEPRRLWKRYLVTNTIFIILSIKAIFNARFKKMFS